MKLKNKCFLFLNCLLLFSVAPQALALAYDKSDFLSLKHRDLKVTLDQVCFSSLDKSIYGTAYSVGLEFIKGWHIYDNDSFKVSKTSLTKEKGSYGSLNQQIMKQMLRGVYVDLGKFDQEQKSLQLKAPWGNFYDAYAKIDSPSLPLFMSSGAKVKKFVGFALVLRSQLTGVTILDAKFALPEVMSRYAATNLVEDLNEEGDEALIFKIFPRVKAAFKTLEKNIFYGKNSRFDSYAKDRNLKSCKETTIKMSYEFL